MIHPVQLATQFGHLDVPAACSRLEQMLTEQIMKV
jgi:hypothetical protein